MVLKDFLEQQPRGASAKLARDLGVPQPLVSQWSAVESPRPVPADKAVLIERITGGAVRVEDLRKDVNWSRTFDPAWPHPQGRPVIDPAKPQKAAA